METVTAADLPAHPTLPRAVDEAVRRVWGHVGLRGVQAEERRKVEARLAAECLWLYYSTAQHLAACAGWWFSDWQATGRTSGKSGAGHGHDVSADTPRS